MDNIKILDCSIRDGGHLNSWNFSDDFAKGVFLAAANSGIDIVELGYMTDKEKMPGCGPWRYVGFDKISEVSSELRADGLDTSISTMIDVGKIDVNNFPASESSDLDLVRVAFYKPQLDDAINDANVLLGKGYEVAVNLMGIVNYSPNERDFALRKLSSLPVSSIYVADSFGSLMPDETFNLVKEFREKTGKDIGFHAHNNIQMAFSNSLSAIDAGAKYIDVTLLGMGRGAGNLPTELFLQYTNKKDSFSKYNLSPILDFIKSEVEPLKTNLGWGYSPLMSLPGIAGCHPKYASALEKEGFSGGEILNILQEVSVKNVSSFKKDLLEEIISKEGLR